MTKERRSTAITKPYVNSFVLSLSLPLYVLFLRQILVHGCDIILLFARTEYLEASSPLPDLSEYGCPSSNSNMKNPHLHNRRCREEKMVEDAVTTMMRIDLCWMFHCLYGYEHSHGAACECC